MVTLVLSHWMPSSVRRRTFSSPRSRSTGEEPKRGTNTSHDQSRRDHIRENSRTELSHNNNNNRLLVTRWWHIRMCTVHVYSLDFIFTHLLSVTLANLQRACFVVRLPWPNNPVYFISKHIGRFREMKCTINTWMMYQNHHGDPDVIITPGPSRTSSAGFACSFLVINHLQVV